MKWIPIDFSATPDFTDHYLIFPSAGCGNVDQLAIDLICFNYGKLIGRIISDNLDFIASVNPFDPNSKYLASTIDAYLCELPNLGKAVVLRVTANLPSQKRRILNYANELVEFMETTKIKSAIMIRSVPALYCIDEQIKDWPVSIRGFGETPKLFNIKKIEEYGDSQELVKITVYGELYQCFSKITKIPFSILFHFVHDGIGTRDAGICAATITGNKTLKIPPYWESLE